MKKLLVITLILSALSVSGKGKPTSMASSRPHYGIKVVNVIKPAKRFKCKDCVVFKTSKYVYKAKRNKRAK